VKLFQAVHVRQGAAGQLCRTTGNNGQFGDGYGSENGGAVWMILMNRVKNELKYVFVLYEDFFTRSVCVIQGSTRHLTHEYLL